MTSFSAPLDDARRHVRNAVRKASPFVERFARFGYAAKGVVYVLVGGLAAAAAFGTAGGDVTSTRGALGRILDAPFGRVLVGLIAAGIACYALWQFIRAVEDPEDEGSDGKAIAKRVGFFGSGVIHFALALAAARMALHRGGGSADGTGDARAQDWTAQLMAAPFGRWLVGLLGAAIAIYGLWRLYRAWVVKLDKRLSLASLSATARRWAVGVSRFGIAARGVVFVLLGAFLIHAARTSDPGKAKGVGGALRSLEAQPYGPWLLGAVALGLVAYGLYEFIRARYRHIEVE